MNLVNGKQTSKTEKDIRSEVIEEFADYILFFVDGYYFGSKEEIIDGFEQHLAELEAERGAR